MRLQKIVLADVLPRGMWKTGLYSRHSAFDPINIEYIGAVAQKAGYDIKILQQRTENSEELVEKILVEEPDLVGYSCMTWSFPFAKELAKMVKQQNKEIINVFGGYHVSAIFEEDVAKDIDETINYIVLGEGEYSFRDLLNCLKHGGDTRDVKGIAFKKGKELIITEPKERIKNSDELPWPLRLKEYLEGNYIVSGVHPAPSKQKSVAQITYSRGCPYKCPYCASPTIWGPKTVYRSSEDLVDEIEFLQEEFGTNLLFFTDLTFNLIKKKVYELCDEIKRRGIEIYWYCMCRPDPDENLLREMKEAGCTRIAWGIETLSDSTLGNILRNYKTKEAMETIRIADSLGISTRAFVILGWPQEEKHYKNLEDYVKQTTVVLKEYAKNGLDGIRMSFLTPFPGTPLYTECKKDNLFLTKDFNKFSSDEEPVIKLKKMKPEELQKARKMIFKGFYESEEYSKHIKEKLEKFSHLKESYYEFFGLLKKNGINVNYLEK
jgi:radical SAM superfamily enzyme YgiQ (UPF0313 family)